MPYSAPLAVSGDFTVAMPVNLPVFTSDFAASEEKTSLVQDFVQYLNDHEPLALGTAHEVYTDYKLVREGEMQDIGAGVVRWKRFYAKIPSSREEWTSISWQVPGLAVGDAHSPIVAVSSFNASVIEGVNTVASVVLASGLQKWNGSSLVNVVSGDNVALIYEQHNAFGVIETNFWTINKIGTLTSTSNFTLNRSILPTNQIPRYITAVTGLNAGRRPETLRVHAKAVYDYHETIDPSEISFNYPEKIYDAYGNQTDTYGHATTPTLTDQLDSVAAGDYVVAQESTIRRWMGNIWERETIYVKNR